ncbi:MAG: 50S ribosomal protein L24 [Candidatus Peribacteraceae bacterium]|nr:50S ribosomal protein L24 [Candidatus Peribacteraceae bacterium]
MKIVSSDTVQIIAGKDKGKTGKVMRALPKTDQVVVEKVNIVTKHIKKRADGTPGQIVKFEKPINVSNVKIVCPNCKKPARVGYRILENGKKARFCKKCNEGIINPKISKK